MGNGSSSRVSLNERSPSAPADGNGTVGDGLRRRPKDRADRILTAAAQLFRERGYHAVGIDAIGEAVGITGPAVYRHFKSKEAILAAAGQRSLERFAAAYAEAAARGGAPSERLAELVRIMIAQTIDDLDLAIVFMREARHVSLERQQEMVKTQRELNAMWQDTLIEVRPQLTRMEARFLLQSLVGEAQSLVYYQSTLARGRLEELLVRMTLVGVLGAVDDGTAHRARGARGVLATRRRRRTPDEPLDRAPVEVVADEGAVRRRSRREAILSVAVRLFREHGFSGIGIDDIGVAAGITGPAIYRHFQNKEDLLAAAFNRATEQLAASVGPALAQARTPRQAVERLIESYVDIVVENTELIAVYVRESHALSADLLQVVRRGQRAYIEDWVATVSHARPELADAEVRVMVHAAIGMVNGYAQGEVRLAPDQMRRYLTSMATASLLDS